MGGLQVQTPDGLWFNAPKVEDIFAVNIGDMLHRITNGLLKSTPHPVINRSGKERYSCPFFFDPHVSFTIVPLPETGDPNFEPLNFGVFLKHKLGSAYKQRNRDVLRKVRTQPQKKYRLKWLLLPLICPVCANQNR